MHEVKRALPEDALVFSEGVTNGKHIEMAIAPEAQGQLVKVRGGGIGPGLPGALGAALAVKLLSDNRSKTKPSNFHVKHMII